MDMDKLLSSRLGEKGCKITASFKKTVQIKPYEPETFEVDAELEYDIELSSMERDAIANVLQSTLEYGVLCHLYKKQLIDKDEFRYNKNSLEISSEAILTKFEKITGKSRNDILHLLEEV